MSGGGEGADGVCSTVGTTEAYFVVPTVVYQGRTVPPGSLPIVKLVFHTDTGPEEANGCNDQPLLTAVYRLHQFGHQPPLQDVALDPASLTQVIRKGADMKGTSGSNGIMKGNNCHTRQPRRHL